MNTFEKRKVVSTLEGLEWTPQRASGNTTRQVDIAIQQLFKGNIVKAEDHWRDGGEREANKLLFRKIVDRLEFEHQLNLGDNNDPEHIRGTIRFNSLVIEIDTRRLTIKILS